MSKVLYGEIADVRAYKSLGVTRITIEAPIEAHVEATSAFHGFPPRKVLVALSGRALETVPFGMLDAVPEDLDGPGSEQYEPTRARKEGRELVGPYCLLSARWCQSSAHQEWLSTEFATLWFGEELQGETPERRAAHIHRSVCLIRSRRELDTDAESRRLFDDRIRTPFMQSQGVTA